jgi:hypothetical protein
MYDMPGSDAWRGVVSTGLTAMLRRRNAAQVLSYSIYDNSSSLPLASAGEFKIDTGCSCRCRRCSGLVSCWQPMQWVEAYSHALE